MSLRRTILAVLAMPAFFVWYLVFSTTPGALTVSFLDVGQGDAIFIQTPAGQQLLIDGGPGRRVLSELSRVMPALDRSIDIVVATHTDLDHLGGLVEVLKRYDIGQVLESGLRVDSGHFVLWDKELQTLNTIRHVAHAGERILLDSGAYIDVLGPAPQDYENLSDKANETMIVLRLVYGETEFLLTGDIERGDELRLVSGSMDIKSDVLKVAHHGSRFSTTDLFLEEVAPQFAVISVGGNNRYGHPHAETLGRIQKTSAHLLRTDLEGPITFTSDGKSVTRR